MTMKMKFNNNNNNNNNIKFNINYSWEATGLNHLLEGDLKRKEKIVL